MYSRSLKPLDSKSFFLFGPRGTGKSSWAKKILSAGCSYIDLLESDTFFSLSADPSRLRSLVRKSPIIVIDEVQKVPPLLDEVHRLIESEKKQFILTGSNGRKLRQGGANLLAGRAITKYMFPLIAEELGEDFSLEQSLRYGCLPAIYSEPDKAAYLSSYVHSYLKEEIQQEGLLRNLGSFTRFLETISFSQASILNVSNIARESSINRNTVADYITILEDLLLAYRLPTFSKRAKREMALHPKFIFFDAGVYRTIRPKGPLDQPEEIDGAALETLFFQQSYAYNSYHDRGYSFYHWRTKSKVEVDFILYGEHGLLAFEIKRSGRISETDLKGLKLFKSDYPQAQTLYLYCGEKESEVDGIQILNIEKFLRNIGEYL